MKKLKVFIVMLAFATLLSGCSLTTKKDTTKDTGNNEKNTDTNNDSNSTIVTLDYCEKFTPEIAKKILGAEVKRTDEGSKTTCTYSTASEDLTNYGIATMVVSGNSKLEAKTLYETAKSTAYGNNTIDIDGLDADSACWSEDLMQLSVLKGDNWIIFSVVSNNYESYQDASVDLAKEMLGKF